ncbi:LiaI-LiaF-like domain-containing protein [Uliginosibacterium sp. sgz301328]|uniref:LiaI-LiaF-like domain-containing protein n=1 Tax=Uliginosibacterium sp. sgz301328 TaxID=3243764 RepID=UPI00359F0217
MSSRTIFLCLFIIGVLFLLANFGIIQIHYVGPIIARWWPALLVFFGVLGLMSKR